MTTTAQSSTRGEYLLVQIELPDKQVQNFGILLLDPRSDQLYSRFRRDFDIWAGEDADWFESLGEEIFERSQELGGQKCLEWMESTLSHAVRVSTRVGVSLDSYQQMVQRLYVEHVLPRCCDSAPISRYSAWKPSRVISANGCRWNPKVG